MYHRFLTFIKKEKLLKEGDKLLLGVSGGVDSMVLAHLVLKTGMDFGIAHVNYKLRGEESDKDAELVRLWCKSHSIPFYRKEVDPAVYHSGRSIQMVARDIRYEFFNELSEKEHYTKILTAHNANDNLETVLFNLTKGTGIAGLTGIAPQKNDLVRPLLFATKEAIYTYARNEGIDWREDQSNSTNDYSRNLLRNEVIPLLKEINPSLEVTFGDSLLRIGGAADLLSAEKERILEGHTSEMKNSCEVAIDWLQNDRRSLLLLSEIIRDYGFNFQDAKDLFQACMEGRVGALFYASGFEINLDRNRLYIHKKEEPWKVDLEIAPQMRQVSTSEFTITLDEIEKNNFPDLGYTNVAFLDASRITYPLRVKNWEQGDRFVPLGMKGKKKISDFMIDSKIAVSLKRKVLVLKSRGEILWVIGHRIDDRFKITPETKKILKVEIKYA